MFQYCLFVKQLEIKLSKKNRTARGKEKLRKECASVNIKSEGWHEVLQTLQLSVVLILTLYLLIKIRLLLLFNDDELMEIATTKAQTKDLTGGLFFHLKMQQIGLDYSLTLIEKLNKQHEFIWAARREDAKVNTLHHVSFPDYFS